MNASPITAGQWDSGLKLDAYLAGMTRNQSVMARRLMFVQLTQAQQETLGRYGRVAHVLVMTEDWCGDAVMNVPIVARIAEALPDADVRVFVRKSSPELNEHYAGRGVTSVPVVTFLDRDFHELATWVERPQPANALQAGWFVANPDLDLTRRSADLTDAERQQRAAKLLELMTVMETWYDAGLQSDTVTEIIALLDQAASDID